MKRDLIIALALAAAVGASAGAGACGGKKKSDADKGQAGGGKGGKGDKGGAGGGAALTAADHPDTTSALWAYAPPDAVLGFVVGDGVGPRVRTEAKALVDELLARKVGPIIGEGLAEMKEEIEFDPFDEAGWKSAGIDINKGFAVFVNIDKDGDDRPFVVVPVVDRAAFVKLAKGKTETVDGKEVDRIEDDTVCMPSGDRYFCAKNVADLEAWSKPQSSKLADAVKQRPAELRGEVEIAVDIAAIPDAKKGMVKLAPFGRFDQVHAALRIEPDGVTLRAVAAGEYGGPIAKGMMAGAAPKALAGRTGGAVSVTWLHVGLVQMALADAPPAIPVGGADLRKDLLDQLNGDFAMVTAGKGLISGVIYLGIEDSAKVKGAVNAVCSMGKAMVGQPSVPIAKLEVSDKGCKGEISLAMLEKELGFTLPNIPVELAVQDGALALAIGEVDPAQPGSGELIDEVGAYESRRILGEPATLVSYSRGFDVDLGAMPAKLLEIVSKEKEWPMIQDLYAWIGGKFYEAGLALAVKPDQVSAELRLTTFAQDPPEAVAAYRGALDKRGAGDREGWKAGLEEVAKKWPTSRVGRRAKLEVAGAPMAGPGGGVALGGVVAWLTLARKIEEPATARGGFGVEAKKEVEAPPPPVKLEKQPEKQPDGVPGEVGGDVIEPKPMKATPKVQP